MPQKHAVIQRMSWRWRQNDSGRLLDRSDLYLESQTWLYYWKCVIQVYTMATEKWWLLSVKIIMHTCTYIWTQHIFFLSIWSTKVSGKEQRYSGLLVSLHTNRIMLWRNTLFQPRPNQRCYFWSQSQPIEWLLQDFFLAPLNSLFSMHQMLSN